MDYKEYGGAALLGISKPTIKAHGSSDAKAFKNAIGQAMRFTSQDVIGAIEGYLAEMKQKSKEPKCMSSQNDLKLCQEKLGCHLR